MPKLVLSTQDLTVPQGLSYGDIKTLSVELENAGDGLLEFEINRIKSSWLAAEPKRGVVKAGEKVQITFTITIGQREAQKMFM